MLLNIGLRHEEESLRTQYSNANDLVERYGRFSPIGLAARWLKVTINWELLKINFLRERGVR